MWQRVVELIGEESASRLRHEFGGERIYIPERKPKKMLIAVVKEKLKTMSYREVAKELGISLNTVIRYSQMD